MVLSMGRWVGKVAVVTGASSGIGAAIAAALVEKGLKVAGLARREDRLDELAEQLAGKQGQFYPVKTDVAKAEDIVAAFKWIKDNLGPVHVLVNNAGVVRLTNLEEGDAEDWKTIFDVNVIGLSIATREAVRDMRANDVDGHIIHIDSVGGHSVGSFLGIGVYSSSKFAVRALAETLRLELDSSKSRIKITNLSPGLVDTEMVSPIFDVKELREQGKILEPEQVADAVIYVLSTPPHVQIQELVIRAILNYV